MDRFVPLVIMLSINSIVWLGSYLASKGSPLVRQVKANVAVISANVVIILITTIWLTIK